MVRPDPNRRPNRVGASADASPFRPEQLSFGLDTVEPEPKPHPEPHPEPTLPHPPRSEPHPDEAALERVAHELDSTLFVTAGAGSGKTRTLVTRLRNLVTKHGVPMRSIAAITFTEKAATELRERVRAEFGRLATEGNPAGRSALDELDGAAIGTLHSFAQRILSEHPIEAGLPPKVEVLDEVASAIAFDERWSAFLDALLGDERMARPLLLLTAANIRPDSLRDIAYELNQNWDLAETRPPAAPPPEEHDWQADLDELLVRLDLVCARRQDCLEQGDRLRTLLDRYAEWAERVAAAPDEAARLELLQPRHGGRPKESANRRGSKKHWPTECDLPALRSELQDISEALAALADEVVHAALLRVAVELRAFTLDAVEQRRREGLLEFHDLLVLARGLLRHPDHGAAVRQRLQERYQRLLIDEFQDTDPIQVELAVLLAAAEPDVRDKVWSDVDVKPGRLFFVGDPKQSIYRFRRADIGLYLRAAERFGAAARVELTANHRSGETLLEHLDATFGKIMTEPSYAPSTARRPDAPTGPVVSVVGEAPHTDRPAADEVRSREATDVAATVRRALDEGWAVDRSEDWAAPDWQPARAGDVAVLLPTRASLPFIEDALAARRVPYRTESSSLVYASRMVRDLFATLRAVEDPTDELMIVTALRSPLFGCGDDELYTFRQQHLGQFDYTVTQPDSVPVDHPVAVGLAYLRARYDERHWATPSELVDRVIRDRRVFELATVQPRGRARDEWHRLRFVTDQARAWTEAKGGTLRQYLAWIRRQATPGARVTEAVLPETDNDAVRIMTVHAAKGLQFPITIVAGLSTQPRRSYSGGQVLWPPQGPALLRVGAKVSTPAYEAFRPLDEQMSHAERIRLLYVACSRARDHLVVSVHRKARSTNGDVEDAKLTSAELLADRGGFADLTKASGGADSVDIGAADVVTLLRASAPPEANLSDAPAPSLPAFDEWQRQRAAALQASTSPRTVAATTLDQEGQPDRASDPGLQKRPRDLDLPPWRKGRYGTAVGRAVHGVLQVIDLQAGNEGAASQSLDAAVTAQATAEGVSGSASETHIASLVRAGLRAPTVIEAGGAPHWKEVHVAVPLAAERTLEGYIDLLYRRPDGRLVVVDYKTGPNQVDADVTPLVEHYRMQGASYALAVEAAAGEPVADVVFVFLTPDGPIERRLPDLPDAITAAFASLGQECRQEEAVGPTS